MDEESQVLSFSPLAVGSGPTRKHAAKATPTAHTWAPRDSHAGHGGLNTSASTGRVGRDSWGAIGRLRIYNGIHVLILRFPPGGGRNRLTKTKTPVSTKKNSKLGIHYNED